MGQKKNLCSYAALQVPKVALEKGVKDEQRLEVTKERLENGETTQKEKGGMSIEGKEPLQLLPLCRVIGHKKSVKSSSQKTHEVSTSPLFSIYVVHYVIYHMYISSTLYRP